MPKREQTDYRLHIADVRRHGCLCGCGKQTEGKALFFNATCRKRHQRRRERWEALPDYSEDLVDAHHLEPELFEEELYK